MLNQNKPQGCMVRLALSGGLIAIASLVMLLADLRGAGAAVILEDELISAFQQEQQQQQQEERLGVIVPAYRGDLERAVSSLSRWPRKCSPVTLENVDLVLYYGEGQDDDDEDTPLVTSAIDTISKTAGSCFARTRAVYAHLSEEENVYPKGPSSMFYKMFLDEDVRSQLSEYNALAVIEWDVLVASEHSFEQLYNAAFHEPQDFWIKGSHMGGTEFHATAGSQELWNVLGHINGNALYNNDDPEFVEYVRYTSARFKLDYPYDVALWLTVSDFPYSWPLWQRYSGKFVTTNLISNVGGVHIDDGMVSEAVAVDTLFIHGSRVEGGSVESLKSVKSSRRLLRSNEEEELERPREKRSRELGSSSRSKSSQKRKSSRKWKSEWSRTDDDDDGDDDGDEDGCLAGCTYTCKDGTKGRVCDTSCETGIPYGINGCGAKQGRFGGNCRVCYYDMDKALKQDDPDDRSIMCETLEPPSAYYSRNLISSEDHGNAPDVARKLSTWTKWQENEKWKSKSSQSDDDDECLSGCDYTSKDGTRGRVCDESCETGDPYGTKGCGARNGRYGDHCRVCYYDIDKALKQDDPDDRSIMCDTLEPPSGYYGRSLLAHKRRDRAPDVARRLSSWMKWKSNEKWKSSKKWKSNWSQDDDDDDECSSGCAYTSNDGTRGRVCDPSCATGDPYGTNGCGARQGRYGEYCRVCYYDLTKALKQDDPDNRAIMCETLEPPSAYDGRNLLSVPSRDDSPAHIARKLREERENHPVTVEALAHVDPSSDLKATEEQLDKEELEKEEEEEEREKESEDVEGTVSFFSKASQRPYSDGLVRGDLCVFIPARAEEIAQWEVTVVSILQFVPGVRVAIAAEEDALDSYESDIGIYPGVTVRSTPDASTASLFADDFCGEGTSLIYYAKPDSVLSRTFTSKDTHSPMGDLLVVYSDSRLCYSDSALARQTNTILGFDAPTFTCGTDLILPVGANADLREALASEKDVLIGDDYEMAADVRTKLREINDISAIPQMLAAIAYEKETPGVWFINPQAWVSEHLFKAASIWEIPLVKPRFSCSLVTTQGVYDVAGVLRHNLDFFTQGGKCENGMMVSS